MSDRFQLWPELPLPLPPDWLSDTPATVRRDGPLASLFQGTTVVRFSMLIYLGTSRSSFEGRPMEVDSPEEKEYDDEDIGTGSAASPQGMPMTEGNLNGEPFLVA